MKISIKNKIKNILKLFRHSKNILNNSAPIYTKRNQGIRLHLGAGKINMQGWINIDAQGEKHIQIIEKDFKLECFSDKSISEIYLSHVLEHFTDYEIQELMDIFKNKLKKGGILRISVPDFDKIIEIYNKKKQNIDKIHPILFGGQDNFYNFHKTAFNKSKLIALFKKNKFKNIKNWDTREIFGTEIGDYSSQKIRIGSKKIPLSLNISGESIN